MLQRELYTGGPETGTIAGGKYRLIEKLSEGSGGMVWKAANPQGREIALKFLKWTPLKSRKIVSERFKNEFAILKTLSHPNISQIYDFGVAAASGLYFFTTELLTQGNLKSMIGAPIPVLEELLVQSLRALEYLRSNRLLHLDIKPENLMLRRDGKHPEVVLIDFGLATFRPSDKPGGTASYMSPEIAARRLASSDSTIALPQPDHRSDLYSLGVTFYHIFTGNQPFRVEIADGRHADTIETMKRHLSYEPPPPSVHRKEIPDYLDRIIMRLMARFPDDRYPSAVIAAQAIGYRSPRKHAPETQRSLLSYLPKEGKLIGRKKEIEEVLQCMKAISEAIPHTTPIICVAGGRGTGRTRFLKAIKPLAQQMEMEVTFIGENEVLDTKAVSEIGAPLKTFMPAARGKFTILPQALHRTVQGQDSPAKIHEFSPGGGNIRRFLEVPIVEDASSSRPPTHAILIDDIDRFIGDDAEDASANAAIRVLIRHLRLQQRLPSEAKKRIFMLFTINSDRIDTAHAQSELNLDESICLPLTISNFTDAELTEYLSAVLGEMPAPSVVSGLKRHTGGNPLFVTDYLSNMIARGKLFSIAGRPDAKTLKTIGIDFLHTPPPKSLAEQVLGKIRRLPKEARDTAIALSCWERPASMEEISAAGGGKPVSHEVLLLVGEGLVRREGNEGRFAFANDLAPSIILKNTDPKAVARCHDAIATYLRHKKGNRSNELDIHLAYGSRTPQRLPALKRLVDYTLGRSEPLDAATHMETILKLLPEKDWSQRADYLAKLGEAYARGGSLNESIKSFRKLAKIVAPKVVRDELKVKSLEHLGIAEMKARRIREARHLFEKELALVRKGNRSLAQRLRIENFLAGCDLREGLVEKAAERFRQTAAVAGKKLTKKERSLMTNNELGEAILQLGQVDMALKVLRRELTDAVAAGNLGNTANRHYLLGNALRHHKIRRYKEAHHHYVMSLKIARANHMMKLEVQIQNGLGNLNLKMQRPQEALRHYHEGLMLAQQVAGETTSIELMIGMGLAAQMLKKSDDTIEYFEAALDFSKGPKGREAGLIRRYLPTIYVSLGDAYFQKHSLERAEKYLREALLLDKKRELSPDLRYSLYGTFVEIFLEQGKTDEAKGYLPALRAIAKSFPPVRRHFQRLNQIMNGTKVSPQ